MEGSLSPLFNQSLEKGMAVLRAFGPNSPTMNLAEIAQATGIGKSAAQRIAYTLETLGYLDKDPVNKRYSLSVATLDLGYRYLIVDRLVERANPFLLDLNRTCGETVNLSKPDGTDMVYVGRFATHKTTPVHMPLGRRLPIYCTSSGRSYLSALALTEREAILRASDLRAYTQYTVTNIPRLLEICQEAKIRGYAYTSSEYYRGDLTVAAAVIDANGRPLGAVNISAPSTRWTMQRVHRDLAPLVIETARLISTQHPDPAQLEPFEAGSGKVHEPRSQPVGRTRRPAHAKS
ncbi:MAG: IclR family transcriptional regulator [Casimicrobiaceae bacterium]